MAYSLFAPRLNMDGLLSSKIYIPSDDELNKYNAIILLSCFIYKYFIQLFTICFINKTTAIVIFKFLCYN